MESDHMNYGWESPDHPESCDYITPQVLESLLGIGVKSVMDIGCGNGALCGSLLEHGISATGLEPDIDGFEFAKCREVVSRMLGTAQAARREAWEPVLLAGTVAIDSSILSPRDELTDHRS